MDVFIPVLPAADTRMIKIRRGHWLRKQFTVCKR